MTERQQEFKIKKLEEKVRYLLFLASGGSPGTGTVTSVDLSVPSFLSVSGNPITGSGTLALSLSGTSLPASSGGTGQTSYTVGDLLYASGTSTISGLAASTSGFVLTSNGAGAAPSYQAAAGGMANPLTTTGDIIYSSSGTTPARLGIGTNNEFLRSNGTTPEWDSIDIVVTGAGTGEAVLFDLGTDILYHKAIGNSTFISAATVTDSIILSLSATGTPDGTTFLRGDNTWATPVSGGSGTVNTGTQYRLAYYATTGTAVSETPAITASRALVSDVNGVPTQATTTSAEIDYVNGVTSAIQTQLDSKVNNSTNQSGIAGDKSWTGNHTIIASDVNVPMLTLEKSGVSGSDYLRFLNSGTEIGSIERTSAGAILIQGGSAAQMQISNTASTGILYNSSHGSGSHTLQVSGTVQLTANSSGVTTATKLTIGGGITPNSSGFKHARVTTGSVGAGATALVTITWGTTFADANYTVNASVLEATTSALSLSVVHIESITASAVTVRVLNNAVGSLTGDVHVMAVHD